MRVDILLAPSRPDLTFEHPRNIQELKHLGLYSYVDETFEAPVSVKRALLAQVRGSRESGRKICGVWRSVTRASCFLTIAYNDLVFSFRCIPFVSGTDCRVTMSKKSEMQA